MKKKTVIKYHPRDVYVPKGGRKPRIKKRRNRKLASIPRYRSKYGIENYQPDDWQDW